MTKFPNLHGFRRSRDPQAPSRLAALSALIVAVVGCSSETEVCQVGEGVCSANVAKNCADEGSGPSWSDQDCGSKICVDGVTGTGAPGAICALEAQPNSACPTDGSLGHTCLGSAIVTCQYGYAMFERQDCGSTDLCVPGLSICVLVPGQEPLCEGKEEDGGHARACDGRQSITCMQGYRIRKDDCGGDDLCYQDTGICIVSTTPDPRCELENPSGEEPHYLCSDNVLVTCYEQYLVKEEDCGAKTCKQLNDYGWPGCYD